MHYYQFNIADYRKDTTHLTIVEHGIYRQLIDWQYLDEKPIPIETQTVMRRLCIGLEFETQLQNVLSDFFVLTENGYVQKRIFDTIESYHGKSQTNKANGKLGGRPRKQGVKTQSVIFANQNESELKANETLTNNHKPRTNNQEPITKEKTTPDGFLAFWNSWPSSERKGAKSKCLDLWIKSNFEKQSQEILSHLGKMVVSASWCEGGGKFIPAPLVYLNGRKWDGAELSSPPSPRSTNATAHSGFAEKDYTLGVLEDGKLA